MSVPEGLRIFSSDSRTYYIDPTNEDIAVDALREFWRKYANHSDCDIKGMGWNISGIFSTQAPNHVARLDVPTGETPDHMGYAPLVMLRKKNGHLEMTILGHNTLVHDPTALYYIGMLLSD
ncbi:MAG TPA: hypothetical protein VJB02_05040 [Coxiellaceae bacterium]|nr:hypothetical protein [Coxiellaceae bacterium]